VYLSSVQAKRCGLNRIVLDTRVFDNQFAAKAFG
jgi:hypothetical protein